MANRRVILKRRTTVRNTRKITRTMQLIATARFQAAHRDWRAQDIKQAIFDLAGPSPGDRTRRTLMGWIANPALSGPSVE